MRILLLSNVLSVHTRKWAKALKTKHTVMIFSFSAPGVNEISELEGIEIVSTGISDTQAYSEHTFHKLGYFKALPTLRKIIREFNPDIIHAHYVSSYGLIGALSGFHPYIISVWGADIYDFPRKSLLHKLIIEFNLRKADAILSTSHVMALQTKKFTDKDVTVTPFGVDLEKFYKIHHPTKTSNDEIVIGTVKTLHKKYGIAFLIKSFKILVERDPDRLLKLMIVGGGPDESELKQLARDLKIDHKIIFTGAISQEKVPEYLNMFDIYVAVSIFDSESFGVAVIEAGACQLPVVVSSVGGLKEVVEDGKTGFVVPPKDPFNTAAAIEKLILSGDLRKEFGENARRRVSDLYDWQKNVDLMNCIYKSLYTHAGA